jgi:hypothetical protein
MARSFFIFGMILILTTQTFAKFHWYNLPLPTPHVNALFPQLPKFLIYCTDQDYAWTLLTDGTFNTFDQNNDDVIEVGEWRCMN